MSMIQVKTTNDISSIARMETKCTGCGACVSVCPRGAIGLVERNGYFLFPEIDSAKCNHCGLCLRTCPSAKPRPAPSRVTNEVAYGCYVKDESARARSSSGGFFQALAKYILRQGGYVCGAAFNKGWHLEHVIISEEQELPPLLGSKYLQSNPKRVYAQIRDLLKKGRMVLFVGTPCQVAACKAVAGENDKLLLTCDLLCHGVPPERLFREHLDCITDGRLSSITDVRFRDKSDEGWNLSHFVVQHEGGVYNSRKIADVYYKAFAESMTIRRSCGDCRYARFPRQGDFTMGDLWVVAEAKLGLKDNKGISAVIVNNKKAADVFRNIKSQFAKVKNACIQDITYENNLQSHSWMHPNAVRFHQLLADPARAETADELMERCLKLDDGICILNFHDGHSNYGSVLTAYALKERIRSIVGFSPIHIHLWPTDGGEQSAGDIIDFNREFLPATCLIRNKWQLEKLNNHFRTFIVGPDVVWRNSKYTLDFHWFLLNFAKFSRNICSYAASFGLPFLGNIDSEDALPVKPIISEVAERKRLMKRFSHISVREDSGVAICHEEFDVQAEHVLDAVFLLKAADYSELIGQKASCASRHPVRYILNPSYSPPDLIRAIESQPNSVSLREGMGDYADRNKTTTAEGKPKEITGVSVRDWLREIRDCDHFATDSFHGICFAIIFRRPFVVLQPSKVAGTERVDSLFRTLGIPHDRYAYTVEDYERILATPLDYSKIESRIEEWIAKSDDYLKRVLADNKPNRVRDWLESIEMLAEANKPQPRATLGQRVSHRMGRMVRNSLRRLRRWGVITDKAKGNIRHVGVLGLPLFTIVQSPGSKKVRLWCVSAFGKPTNRTTGSPHVSKTAGR